MNDLADGIGLMEWDWCYTARATRLHHASLTVEQYEDLGEWAHLIDDGAVRTACGRILMWPSIPGIFSRMGMPRCTRCCTRLGYPQGVGSPKNDSAIRPLVEARIAHLHTTINGARS